MRDLYYADRRDVVKWGVLLELVNRSGARHILQVLYYRSTQWPDLDVDGTMVPLHESVRKHFRDAASICGLPSSARIEVVENLFVDRGAYLEIVKNRIHVRAESPGIVFLDPDTGLEPASTGFEHVLESELDEIWRALPDGDLFVLYQHQTNRSGGPWLETKKRQFERSLGLSAQAVRVARAPEIASDVAFFFAQKGAMEGRSPHPEGAEVGSENRTLTVQDALDCLNRTQTRATYAAVASVIGGLAVDVGKRLGRRRRPEA